MKREDMVRMANQIADFFAPYPEDEAVMGIAEHLKNFWDPRMKDQLKAHLDAGGEGLKPLAHAGARKLFA